MAMRMPSQKYSAGVLVASVVYGRKILVKTPEEEEEEELEERDDEVVAVPSSDGGCLCWWYTKGCTGGCWW